MAMEIARERVELRKKAQKVGFFDASRREKGQPATESGVSG
jgi:hypothetical protein